MRSGVQWIILARGNRRPSSLAPPDGNGGRQENYLDHEENSSDLCGLPSVTEHGGDAAIASGISIAGRAGTVRDLSNDDADVSLTPLTADGVQGQWHVARVSLVLPWRPPPPSQRLFCRTSELPHELPHEMPHKMLHEMPHKLQLELPHELPHEMPHEMLHEMRHKMPHKLPHELPLELRHVLIGKPIGKA